MRLYDTPAHSTTVNACHAMLRQLACHTWFMATVTFHEWVKAVFDHPLGTREWYWDNDFEEHWSALELSDSVAVEYMTRLFLGPERLDRYSLEQVAQGIWFLIGESSPGQLAHTLLKSNVPLQQRVGCVDAMTHFFRVFVAPAAPGAADDRKKPFHIACYMWWDIFPTYGNPNTGEADLHDACLNAMAAILIIPCELCQLSALHGLNHWHLHHAEKVESIVDAFLQKSSGLTSRIVEYAATARSGCAQ
jgi:hypothetical protein